MDNTKTELPKRAYIIEVNGRIIALREENREFNFAQVEYCPLTDSYDDLNWSKTEKGAKKHKSIKNWEGRGETMAVKEIFTLAEFKYARDSVLAERKRSSMILKALIKKYPQYCTYNKYGTCRFSDDLTNEVRIQRAKATWAEIILKRLK